MPVMGLFVYHKKISQPAFCFCGLGAESSSEELVSSSSNTNTTTQIIKIHLKYSGNMTGTRIFLAVSNSLSKWMSETGCIELTAFVMKLPPISKTIFATP